MTAIIVPHKLALTAKYYTILTISTVNVTLMNSLACKTL